MKLRQRAIAEHRVLKRPYGSQSPAARPGVPAGANRGRLMGLGTAPAGYWALT